MRARRGIVTGAGTVASATIATIRVSREAMLPGLR